MILWWYKYSIVFGGENIAQSWDASTLKCYVSSNDANNQGIFSVPDLLKKELGLENYSMY